MDPQDVSAVRQMSEGEWRVWMASNVTRISNLAEEAVAQTKRTNGRVSRLELWRAGIVGALGLLTAATPVLIWFMNAFVIGK